MSDPPNALFDLLPRLEEFLKLVDPPRVPRAQELLLEFDSEEELFAALQEEYGNVFREKQDDLSDNKSAPLDEPKVDRRDQSSEPSKDDGLYQGGGGTGSAESDDEYHGPQRRVQRPICKYGRDCYRKNPDHFKEFRHPWKDSE